MWSDMYFEAIEGIILMVCKDYDGLMVT
jgi:hypothetical protein